MNHVRFDQFPSINNMNDQDKASKYNLSIKATSRCTESNCMPLYQRRSHSLCTGLQGFFVVASNVLVVFATLWEVQIDNRRSRESCRYDCRGD
ncbi:hypothetical protein J6590_043653 [Homalodisca vitripennis]|nr:hypothetical protein J6590_043653 [Homalodisca vitripennis]